MDTLEESSSISINDPTNEQYEIYKAKQLKKQDSRDRRLWKLI